MLIEEQYKHKLIKTLIAFDSFCKDNNLRYFASGGTAIGAVRHKGMIPWDDDIDVVMIREDYDRFLSLKEQLHGSQYQILSPTDKGYYLPYPKFVDANTTIWEVADHEFLIGVYIDVFPLNHVSDDIDKIKNFQKKYLRVCAHYFGSEKCLFRKTVLQSLALSHPKTIKNWISHLLISKPLRRYFKRLFWRYEGMLKDSKGNRLLNYYTQYEMEKELLLPQWFERQIRLPFEDTEINIMNGYENYLTQLHGNYMILPPIEKRVSHHSRYFINLDRRMTLEEIKEFMKKNAVHEG